MQQILRFVGKPSGGHVAVIIDGKFMGLQSDGTGSEPIDVPPSKHWYTITLFGQPHDSVDWSLTADGKSVGKGKLMIGGTDTSISTFRVDFIL